ncbi:hypothetical protein [Acaryochloris sp. CCMEE 5410]|uniref:hypothetical protein n=1 Tax=Acaryochloris sp. CCMEE 5410 TaxID=310037 RepID=UPI0002483FCF|nr:hypothetical protein [Acaryochloris sp. CCMEE 5410]KAI9129351.1 hypothetical protein ON05_035085 [Acaryochloris sp. CCMEE 5410]
MTHIPTLNYHQLELLRLAKKHSVEEIHFDYELPYINDCKPPSGHPSFIQELIDEHLIQVQERGTSLCASLFQKESWTNFSKEIDYPNQTDWDRWRQGFIAQLDEGFVYLMTPGRGYGEFCKVWIREISIRAVQPSSL